MTEAAGLGGARGDRFSFADVDQDGDPDLLVGGARLYRNDTLAFGRTVAEIRFTDVTAESGIGQGPGGGACWTDLDGDGDLDVVTTGGAVKIQHEPLEFRDDAVSWGLELAKPMASIGVGDVDGDRRPDVLFTGGEDWNDANPRYWPRLLLRNVDGKSFADVTAEHDLDGARYGRAAVFADADRDGDLDVYVGNYRLQANEYLRSEEGRLVDRAGEAGVAGRRSDDRGRLPDGRAVGFQYGHTIAAAWGDLDLDGDLDLWVSNLVHKYVGPEPRFPGGFDYRGWICDDSAIYRNDGPPLWAFTDVRAESGIPLRPVGDRSVFRGDELWSHAAVADLDLDGLPEVFVTQVYQLPYSHSLLFHNLGGLRFEEVSESAGVRRFDSYGGAFADVDGDGDVDLVADGRPGPEGEREVRLYRNETAPGRWIGFRLKGPGKDPMPVGAEVRLVFADGALVRHVEGASGGHAQQNEEILRFGLGDRAIREAWARWPGGVFQALGTPEPGRVHEVPYPTVQVPGMVLEDEVQEVVVPDEGVDGGGPRTVRRLRARVRASAAWTLSFDLDGDGAFETRSRDGRVTVTVTLRREVRVRLYHAGRRVGREGVWRLEPLSSGG